ncbi:hypothetical protein LTR56_009732 [Elasticomyces elasticus]|nr:hypothetical protein LTR56_009732 [Elasticomyces elasticus]KAK3653543.1 hypothetical protein LTR22_011217 [Elasticomyces elasticus]KAK4919152.1 hypothetical protein LTR49_013156 [Elasticomyces elasticus]KAK5753194.1 hypothetical protein LTS12_016765 [Elasticomyces elasticus]
MATEGCDADGVAKSQFSVSAPFKRTSDIILKHSIRSKHVFPFEKLPAELRNRVYELALIAAKSIEVVKHLNVSKEEFRRRKDCCRDGPLKCYLCKGAPTHRFEAKTLVMRGKQNRRLLAGKTLSGAILRANRQINQETTAVLYGGNKFVFNGPAAFRMFWMAGLKTYRVLLRNVEVKNVRPSAHIDMFGTGMAWNLDRLKLSGVSCGRPITTEHMFRLLGQLIRVPGTEGCRCLGFLVHDCRCRTAEQERLFEGIDISAFDRLHTMGSETGQVKWDAKDALDVIWESRIGILAKLRRSQKQECKDQECVLEEQDHCV